MAAIADLLLYETGGGGDLLLRGNGLVGVTGYETAVYLAMFGGEESWWGNKVISANKFNSKTEKALRENALNSSGRRAIEDAVKADLSFLQDIQGTTYTVSTTIEGPNRLSIDITINGEKFSYGWNPDTMFLTYKVA